MRQTFIVLFVSAGTLIAAASAVAQTSSGQTYPSTSWHTDVSPSVTFSPGLGEPVRAAGATGAVSVLRSETEGQFGRTRCLGVTATYGHMWSGLSNGDDRTEQWVIAGPRFDNHPGVEGIYGTIQPFVGVKRVPARHRSPSSANHLTYGVVFSIPIETTDIAGHRAAIRLLDLTYIATSGDPGSRHRLLISAGLDLGLK